MNFQQYCKKRVLVYCCFCLFCLVSCQDNSPLKQAQKAVGTVATQSYPRIPPLQPLPEVKLTSYDTVASLPDPFKPVLDLAALKQNLDHPKEPLETYSLDSLRVVGTLSEGALTWALVEAPSGIVYRATIGNYIGKNYGKITKITNNEVTVVEYIATGFAAETRTVTLPLVSATQSEKNTAVSSKE